MSILSAIKAAFVRLVFDPDDPAYQRNRERFERAQQEIRREIVELQKTSHDLVKMAGESRRQSDAFASLVREIRGKAKQHERD